MSDALFAYVASPYGFSEAGRLFYEEKLIPLVERAGFAVIDPWKLTSPVLIAQAESMPFGPEQKRFWADGVNPTIGRNNSEGIKRSHLLLGCLDGPDVDSGTAGEIGFAAGLGKAIEGYRNDFRISADNIGGIVNIQIEAFVKMGGGVISRTLDELAPRLEKRRRELHKALRHAH
jgi:nucleoside 2-deoxyribosyltransferase